MYTLERWTGDTDGIMPNHEILFSSPYIDAAVRVLAIIVQRYCDGSRAITIQQTGINIFTITTSEFYSIRHGKQAINIFDYVREIFSI